MIKALVDEAIPTDLVAVLSDEAIGVDQFPERWRSLSDGDLISKAIAERYDWLITCDKRMAYQQNLKDRAISVLVLPTPRVPEIERIKRDVLEVLRQPLPGNFILLDSNGSLVGKPASHLAGATKRIP